MAINFKQFFDQALQRGEKIKTQVFEDLLESSVVQQLLQNENVIQGLVSLFTAKEKIERKVKKGLRSILRSFEIPTLVEYSQVHHRMAELERRLVELQDVQQKFAHHSHGSAETQKPVQAPKKTEMPAKSAAKLTRSRKK